MVKKTGKVKDVGTLSRKQIALLKWFLLAGIFVYLIKELITSIESTTTWILVLLFAWSVLEIILHYQSN